MKYKVLKMFKCRHHDLKVFREGDEYTSSDEKHTEKLIKLGFIKAVEEKKKTTPKKTVTKKAETKTVDKK